MRKYHRWLSVLFGLLILFIAVTGVVTQGARLYAIGEPERARSTQASAPAARIGEAEDTDEAEAPKATPAARPPQSPLKQFIHFVTELHSGEEFGIVGQLVSLVSGLALIFFAFSGLWMYIQMFRRRSHRARHSKKIFW
ncbi:PepSY-associated TM helix domain-containing protein [Sphingomonas sp.]|uniref:PepSY-associated TM helix domain-containing protein n=1 Tax=Sphingomonas sp. TaxID=28214 RepID=UPI00286CA0FC|nr:PepSY-associated TM helix domain-containing protein [Sphingomonas sp.]